MNEYEGVMSGSKSSYSCECERAGTERSDDSETRNTTVNATF